VLAVLRTVPGRTLLRRASVSSLVGAAEPHMCAELLMLRAASGHASVLTRCSYDNSCANPRDGEKTSFLRHLHIKCIILPRQARDKHRESTQKRMRWDQQRNAQMMQTRRNGKENAMFAPLSTKNAQFTKTGSG
jgi:hypothetical protein